MSLQKIDKYVPWWLWIIIGTWHVFTVLKAIVGFESDNSTAALVMTFILALTPGVAMIAVGLVKRTTDSDATNQREK